MFLSTYGLDGATLLYNFLNSAEFNDILFVFIFVSGVSHGSR